MKFTTGNEWLRMEGENVVIGITEHAVAQLGDIVFIELKSPGDLINRGDEVAMIESVKAASEISAPLDGELVEVNEDIVETPSLVNEDPLGRGWFIKMKITSPMLLENFMDKAAYQALVD